MVEVLNPSRFEDVDTITCHEPVFQYADREPEPGYVCRVLGKRAGSELEDEYVMRSVQLHVDTEEAIIDDVDGSIMVHPPSDTCELFGQSRYAGNLGHLRCPPDSEAPPVEI